MTHRNRISSSYAEEREALGPLPWVLSAPVRPVRRQESWLGPVACLLLIAALIGVFALLGA